MAKEWLGFGGNVVALASGKHISLKNAAGVTFLLYEDGGAQSAVFVQSKAGAEEKPVTFINHYYANSGLGTAWTRETADADATLDDDHTFVKKDTVNFDLAVVYFPASALDESNGFDSVECTIQAETGAMCVAIIHDLAVQRTPANLPAAAVA